MYRTYIILCFTFLFSQCNESNKSYNKKINDDWIMFCNKHGTYKVHFPNEPTNYDTVITNHFKKYNVKSYYVFYNCDTNELNDFYLIEYKTYPDSVLKMIGFDNVKLIDSYIDSLKTSLDAEVINTKHIESYHYVCESKISKMMSKSNGSVLNIGITMCGNTLYTLIVSSNKIEQENIYIDKFISSFSVGHCD